MRDEAAIRKVMGEFFRPGHHYHSPLPDALDDWYAYASDSGHNVLVILPRDYRSGEDLTDSLCPAPVKSVLRRGWEVRGEYVVCDLPYSPTMGLRTDPADDEH